MTFLKKKNFWIIAGLALIGLWLRLIFINKPEGLWNDEYTSWAIASLPLFSKSFWAGIASQCHMPFYYLYLKIFIRFFGNSDTMLRLTSVLPGILSIIVMYFVGKEFKDEKLGVLTSTITSFSAFLIYFSQEVRIYSVLFLFSALALLYTLKLGKKQCKSNFIIFILTNFLVLFTHTIGFVFVFFNLIFLSCWINKSTDKYKKSIKYLWISVGILFLLLLPLTFKIFTAKTFAQWWSHFTFAKILFMLTDFLSPVITNIVDSPQNFFSGMTYAFILFGIIPTIIALCALIKALSTKKYEALGLFYVSLSVVIVLAIVSMTGKLVFLTKYAIEIYPALMLLVAYGFLEFKTKWLEKLLIIIYICSNLFYNISFPNSAPRMHRSQGHKIVANLLKDANLKPGDIIILNYYPKDKFEKYFNFNDYRVFSINKGTFVDYISSEKDFNKIYKKGKQLYFNNFNASDNSYFDKYFNKNIITKLKPHQKLVIINLETVSMFSPVQMIEITSSYNLYKETPLLFLVFSYIKNEEMSVCLKKLNIQRIETKGSWAATTFEKL